MTPDVINSKMVSWIVLPAFFLSGVASLACEVVWFKLFGLVLGNGTFSASSVVAVFFVGLGLGSIVTGRVSDRWARPLRAYAMLEGALSVCSLATSIALLNWQSWIGLFRGWMAIDASTAMPLKLLLASVLLLPPTMLMGSTLPVLSRYLVRNRDKLSARVGLLYTLNTVGAAVGTALVGFFLIGAIGVTATSLIGSGIYAAIALAAGWLSLQEEPLEPDSLVDDAPEERVDRRAPVLIAVFAMSGFASVSYEILWFRLISYFSVNTVYAFSGLLFVYLGGLVIGAAIASRWLSAYRDQHLAWFARLQLAIAVAGLLTLAFLGRVPMLLYTADVQWLSVSGMLKLLVIVAIILGPPATLIGITFPLASEITVENLRGLGSRLGLVYGLNTIFGAMGSLLMGFVLLPSIGSQGAALLLTAINLALFGAIAATHPEMWRAPGQKREALLTVVMVVAAAAWLGPDYLRHAQTRFVSAEVLEFKEAPDGTFVTLEYEEEGLRYQQVVVNGTSYANNRPPGRRYMALLAHLPMLLSDHPDQVVVICVGTGTTVGSASLHDRTGRVWAVDISAEVFQIAKYFVPWNKRFFESERVKPVVADGRHFLTVADGPFDVLTFEPPPPIEAGVANLYSREFYTLAKSRMRRDAIVAQWLPMHQGFAELQKQMTQSMMEVYPHVSMWVADRREGILLGSEEPLQIDVETLRRRMAEPDIASDLHAVGITNVEDLLATFVAADEDLKGWVGDVPPVTDDRPSVERFLFYDNEPVPMASLLKHRGRVEDLFVGPYDAAALDRSRAWTDILWTAVDAYLEKRPQEAHDLLTPALEIVPDNPYVHYRLREFQRAIDRQE